MVRTLFHAEGLREATFSRRDMPQHADTARQPRKRTSRRRIRMMNITSFTAWSAYDTIVYRRADDARHRHEAIYC